MKVTIELECDFNPREQISVGLDWQPDDMKLTVEQQIMLRGAAQRAIDQLPTTNILNQ